MSDNDFIIIDEEKETPVTTEGKESSDTEKKEVFQTSAKEEHEDEYEKICFICHRPESVTGKMIDLPNHITVCPDCMQKSFDPFFSANRKKSGKSSQNSHKFR